MATIEFRELIQEGEERSGAADYLFGHVKFNLRTSDGTDHDEGLVATFKMTSGGEVATAPISPPQGFEGPLHYNLFQRAVESYVRSVLTQTIRAASASKWLRFRVKGGFYE